jgi:DNA-binding response OmpR family regulator
MKILIVDDETRVARFIKKAFMELGYCCDTCANGNEALEMILSSSYDAIILDIMLPGLDGLALLKRLRKKSCAIPVLLLSARGSVDERVEGLNLGADDYLPKPFSTDELTARVQALIRRSSGQSLSIYQVGCLRMELLNHTVYRNEQVVLLTAREFGLLEFLMRTPGRVFTRTQICEAVWSYQFDPGTNLVDVYIQRLRSKIDQGYDDTYIQTIRGVGYCIRKEPAE